MSSQTWSLAEAKGKFSELLEKGNFGGSAKDHEAWSNDCSGGRRGRVEPPAGAQSNLAEFLASSPWRGPGLKIRSVRVRLRKVEL